LSTKANENRLFGGQQLNLINIVFYSYYGYNLEIRCPIIIRPSHWTDPEIFPYSRLAQCTARKSSAPICKVQCEIVKAVELKNLRCFELKISNHIVQLEVNLDFGLLASLYNHYP